MGSRVKSPGKKAISKEKRTGAEIMPKYTGPGWPGVDILKPGTVHDGKGQVGDVVDYVD